MGQFSPSQLLPSSSMTTWVTRKITTRNQKRDQDGVKMKLINSKTPPMEPLSGNVDQETQITKIPIWQNDANSNAKMVLLDLETKRFTAKKDHSGHSERETAKLPPELVYKFTS